MRVRAPCVCRRFPAVGLIKLSSWAVPSWLRADVLTDSPVFVCQRLPSLSHRCGGLKGQNPAGQSVNPVLACLSPLRVSPCCLSLASLLSHVLCCLTNALLVLDGDIFVTGCSRWSPLSGRTGFAQGCDSPLSYLTGCWIPALACLCPVSLGNVDGGLPGSGRAETPEEAGFWTPHLQAGRAEQQQQQLGVHAAASQSTARGG